MLKRCFKKSQEEPMEILGFQQTEKKEGFNLFSASKCDTH